MSDKSRGFFQIGALGFILVILVVVLGSMFYVGWKLMTAQGSATAEKAKTDSVAKPEFIRIYRQYSDEDFIYRLHIDSIRYPENGSRDSVYHIEVLKKISKQKLQDIDPGSNPMLSSLDQEQLQRFVIEDMNFDGYKDIRLMNWLGGRRQQIFTCWLFDPAKNKFVEDTSLSKLADTEFDPVTKTVFANMRTGCCADHLSELFTWENGKLVLQRSEELMTNPYGGYDATLRRSKRINGKMIQTETEIDSVTDDLSFSNREKINAF